MDDSKFSLLLDLVLDLKEDQAEIKETTLRNTIVLERNTEIVLEHERRSTASEARLERLEKIEQMFTGFLKISGMILAAVASVYGVVEIIQKLL